MCVYVSVTECLPLPIAWLCHGACVEVDSDTEAVAGEGFKLGCISCKMRGEVPASATVDWWFKATDESEFTHVSMRPNAGLYSLTSRVWETQMPFPPHNALPKLTCRCIFTRAKALAQLCGCVLTHTQESMTLNYFHCKIKHPNPKADLRLLHFLMQGLYHALFMTIFVARSELLHITALYFEYVYEEDKEVLCHWKY